MLSKIEFIAQEDGDMECFCWKVTPEQKLHIVGEEQYNNDIYWEKEFLDDRGEQNLTPEEIDEKILNSFELTHVYPDDIVKALFPNETDRKKKIKYTIIAELMND